MPVNTLRKRAPLLAATGLASAVLVAGCGGSSASRTAASPAAAVSGSTAVAGGAAARSGPPGAGADGSGLAFSKCMRANGVPNFPDLGANGMLIEGGAGGQTVSVNGVSVNAPAFETARRKCQEYLPQSHPSPAQTAQDRQRGLEFAECMRSHGVPNYPDPKVISSSGGNQTVYLPGINPWSPAFQAGAKACGGFGPKGP